jgi:recombination protein RecA
MSTVPVELPTTKAEKLKASEIVAASIEKKYGDGAVFDMMKQSKIIMPHIPTGIWTLDNYVLSIGGAPKGRILEFFGPESSGKTTLALRIIASAQSEGGLCAVIDAENALDPSWAVTNGVNVRDLTVSQPDSGEEALDIAAMLIDSGAYSVIVVDSVSALVPKAELSGEIGDAHVGLQARLMSQGCRMLSSKVRRAGTILIFINQIREKIGISWGSPETTSGGRALKFYSSVRMDVRRIATLKDNELAYGNRVKLKCVKNKVGPPYREMDCDLLFNSGFSIAGDLFDAAVAKKIVDKSGAWFSYKDKRVGQGRKNAIEFLLTQPEISDKIKSELETSTFGGNSGTKS